MEKFGKSIPFHLWAISINHSTDTRENIVPVLKTLPPKRYMKKDRMYNQIGMGNY